MRGSSVMFVPLTWNFPASVFVFMSTNLIVATLQNRMLKIPVLERLLEIPPTAERVAAINAAAAADGPATLTPLADTFRRDQRLSGGISAARQPFSLQPPLAEQLQVSTSTPSGRRLPSRQAVSPERERKAERSSLANLEVSPR